MKKPIEATNEDRRKYNPGRPKVISERRTRQLVRQVHLLRKEKKGVFNLRDIRKAAGIESKISDTSVRRTLHKQGFKYRQSAHKGVLSEEDVKKRYRFAKAIKKKYSESVWWDGICFYLDGTGFTHKVNPCEYAMRSNRSTWRKEKERLSLNCTARGRQEGSGGRVAKFMVAIAYRKGVTMCANYDVTLNGPSFAKFISRKFNACFRKSNNGQKERIFLQDGDPSQNSRLARDAMDKVKASQFSIPARSPDLNPIENIFHIAKRRMKREAIENKITHESYAEFLQRIEQTLKSIPVEIIDRTIASMPKRINEVISRKGQRTKY